MADGYVVLADISGYTEFLTGTELEHSHAIVTELTKLIRSNLVPPLRFVKLEGDAVFCYASTAAFAGVEQLLELVESTYYGFASRLIDMTRSTTCRCDACRAIGDLDLKFVAHRGSFIADVDDGRVDLAGPDVILVHRLLKNSIIDSGGPEAYAFLTDACGPHAALRSGLSPHVESYESFGEVTGVVQDLAAVAAARRESHRLRIEPADADLDVSYVVDAPAAVVWQYFVDPEKRARAMADIETSVVFSPNQDGRIGAGASSHCAHGPGVGDALREYLDWRPFEYFTCRLTPVPDQDGILTPWVETCSFAPAADGATEFRWTIRSENRTAEGLAAFEVLASLIRDAATQPEFGDTMRHAIADDRATYGIQHIP